MVFCCFVVQRAAKEHQPVVQNSAAVRTSPKSVYAIEGKEASPIPERFLDNTTATVSALRCHLAAVQGSWLARAYACVESVHGACRPVAQVSLFGASPSGTTLASIASTSRHTPGAALAPGLVLPMPWILMGRGVEPTKALGKGAADGMLFYLGATGSAAAAATGMATGRGNEPDILVWQVQTAATAHTANMVPTSAISRQTTLTSNMKAAPAAPALMSACEPPGEWRPLLRSIALELAAATAAPGLQAAAAAAPPSPLNVTMALVPLRLGPDLVGALLLVSEPPPPGRMPAALAPTVSGTAVAAAAGGADGCVGVPPEWSAELLMGVAAAVTECCVGPHMVDIQRVTGAADDVAAAPDVQGLASAFSAALTEALSSDLHVDFAVRVALVPQMYGTRQNANSTTTALTAQYGFMLTEQQQVVVPQQTLSQLQQHQQGVGVSLLDGPSVARYSVQGAPSRGSLRVVSHQPAIERLLAQAGSRHGSSLSSGPSVWESVGGAASPHHPLLTHGSQAGQAAGAAIQNMVMSSGAHSFHLPGPCARGGGSGEAPNRAWKARPFSLEATLLASLASKAIRVGVPGVAASGGGGGGGGGGSGSNANWPAGFSPAVTASTALSGYDDVGAAALSAYARTMQVPSAAASTSSFAAVSAQAGAIHGLGGGGGRISSSIVPHVHAYVNDTDQPSGDVMLLFRTGAGAGGGGAGGGSTAGGGMGSVGGRGSYPLSGPASIAGGGGMSAAASGPASLILVAGCVGLPGSGIGGGGCGGEEDRQTAAMRYTMAASRGAVRSQPTTGSGMAPPPSQAPASPLLAAAASGDGGEASVWVGLYLTSQDRLPTSLLLAARDRAQLLLELLLPAAAACFADSALSELEFMCEAVGGGGGGSSAGGPFGRANSNLPSGRQQHITSRTPLHSPFRHQTSGLGPDDVPSTRGASAAAAGIVAPVVPRSSRPAAAAAAAGGGVTAGSMPAGVAGGGGGSLRLSVSLRGSSRDGLMESDAMLTTGATESSGACNLQLPAAPVSAGSATPFAWPGHHSNPGGLLTSTLRDTALELSPPPAPRSRLSQASARMEASAVAAAAAAALTLATTTSPPTGSGPAQLLISSNSLLIGSGSSMGRTALTTGGHVGGGGGGGGGGGLGADVFDLAAASLTTMRRGGGGGGGGGGSRLTTLPSGLLASGMGRSSNRMPRQHVSELLATMPCDVFDTLTVMRTNMDVLVSSFWNTLRSQNADGTPSPHADEDLRFLRLTKVLGGGGCSTVYSGLLHGLEVAVKVMKAQLDPELDEDAEEGGAEDTPAAQQQAVAQAGGGGEASPSPAARQAQLRALMRGARELAVMTSISHPNIVQIYSYHTRVLVQPDVDDANGGGGGCGVVHGASASASCALPRLVPVPSDADLSAVSDPLQTVLIMECCDLGSLADALDSGMFANAVRAAESARWRNAPPRRSLTFSQLSSIPSTHAGGSGSSGTGGGRGVNSGASGRPVAGRTAAVGGSGVAMQAVYLTLLEVALALRHMHSLNLVHCDVKPANVLLKSSASDPRGFTCKLTDFGFVNLLQYQLGDADDPAAKPSMRYHEPVGTVTHLAPETMVQGSKLDHTVDIFAFGILMWEVFTGKAPYAEHAGSNFRDVPYLVVRDGVRPVFPPATPSAFKSLAHACWSADATRRPTAAALVGSLQRLMDTATRS